MSGGHRRYLEREKKERRILCVKDTGNVSVYTQKDKSGKKKRSGSKSTKKKLLTTSWWFLTVSDFLPNMPLDEKEKKKKRKKEQKTKEKQKRKERRDEDYIYFCQSESVWALIEKKHENIQTKISLPRSFNHLKKF